MPIAIMPLKYIDEIAREKQRDVLFLEFHPLQTLNPYCTESLEYEIKWFESEMRTQSYRYTEDKIRDEIIENLNKMNIPWELCEGLPTGYLESSKGQIYLDVPFDENLPQYQALQEYLEYPDGTMRFPTVRFHFLTLEKAMENVNNDKVWNEWA
jgi:hypothetical protein